MRMHTLDPSGAQVRRDICFVPQGRRQLTSGPTTCATGLGSAYGIRVRPNGVFPPRLTWYRVSNGTKGHLVIRGREFAHPARGLSQQRVPRHNNVRNLELALSYPTDTRYNRILTHLSCSSYVLGDYTYLQVYG